MMDNRKYETAILEIFREAPEKYDTMIAGKDDPFLFAACSNLRNALICWYPLDKNQKVLQIGAGYGALTGYLADHCGSIAILENDPFQIEALSTRLKDKDNLRIISELDGSRYDLIVMTEDLRNNLKYLEGAAAALKEDGSLLLGYINRDGMKGKCGKKDHIQGDFDWTKKEADLFAKKAGLASAFHYYILPDQYFAQAVFSDDSLPDAPIQDRVFIYDMWKQPADDETLLLKETISDNALKDHANYILAEYSRESTQKIRPVKAYLSADRGREHSFATVFYSDDSVIKHPIYEEGKEYLKKLYMNMEELRNRNILIVPHEFVAGSIRMPVIHETQALSRISELRANNEKEGILSLFDELQKNILKSSDTYADSRYGTILKHGYIDMIPYNCFIGNRGIRYYDQEFVVDDCPALYIMFRAIYYTYIHEPELETVLSEQEMIARYNLSGLWDEMVDRENAFVSENRNWEMYSQIYLWAARASENIRNKIEGKNI